MRPRRDLLRGDRPAPFVLLQRRETVVSFHETPGRMRLAQSVRSLDPDEGHWTTGDGPAMLLAAMAPLDDWPGEGLIDLRGLPW